MSRQKSISHHFKIGGFVPESDFAALLIPLLDALGWKGSNTDLVEAMVSNPSQMDREGFLETLANLRFEGRVQKTRRFRPDGRLLPAVCISRSGHHSCLIRKTDEGWLSYDAEKREYRIISRPGNIRTIIHFTPLKPEQNSLLHPLKNWFLHLLFRFKKEFAFSILISILLTLFSFMTPLFIMLIYGQLRSAEDWRIILSLGSAALIFVSAGAGFHILRGRLLSYLAERIGNLIGNEIFRRLLYLPPRYTELASVESQMNRLKDFESIRDFIGSSSLTSLMDAPLSLLLLPGLAWIAGPLAAIPVAAILLFLTAGLISYKVFQKLSIRTADLNNRRRLLRQEIIEDIADIRLGLYPELWQKRLGEISAETLLQNHNSRKFIRLASSLSSLLVNLSLILTIAVGVQLVINGSLNSGALFAAFLLTSRILTPLRNGIPVLSQLSRLIRSIRQLNRFMTLPLESRPETMITLHKHIEGDIRFREVYLRYEKEFAPALRNISFNLKKGRMLSIIGHAGSGRSSMIKLLLGLYEPFSGSILFDNMNLKQIDPLRLRKSIAWSPADPVIFDGTLRSHFYLAKPDATDTEILEVLKQTGLINGILSLPDGLESSAADFIGSSPHPSASRWLNLAMALLRNSPLLILEEPEAGLSGSELEKLQDILKTRGSHVTLIITTRSPKMLKISDSILWLDNGRVLRSGPSKELLRQCTAFLETRQENDYET